MNSRSLCTLSFVLSGLLNGSGLLAQDQTGKWLCEGVHRDSGNHSVVYRNSLEMVISRISSRELMSVESHYHYTFSSGREIPDESEVNESRWYLLTGGLYIDTRPSAPRALEKGDTYLRLLDANTLRMASDDGVMEFSCSRLAANAAPLPTQPLVQLPTATPVTPLRMSGVKVDEGGCDSAGRRVVFVSFMLTGGEAGKQYLWTISRENPGGSEEKMRGFSVSPATVGRTITCDEYPVEVVSVFVAAGVGNKETRRVQACPSTKNPR